MRNNTNSEMFKGSVYSSIQSKMAAIISSLSTCIGLLMLTIMFTISLTSYAQQSNVIQPPSNPARANIWYFGDSTGLDFSNGTPVVLKNGSMMSFECAGVMCDVNGNLLFYTNGGDYPYPGGVWNRNNQLMPNGGTFGRGGCNNSEQGSMIVPCPRSQNLYYLFTTDCMENNGVGGLRYNIIDMNADTGRGDVVVAAQKLTTPSDESLAVIQHANGVDWWIVSHKLQTDSFYVYQLNKHGIVGLVITEIGNVTPYWAGALKATTDGSKLVYAGLNWTTLFDFDNNTGKISNPVDLNLAGYTAAFSDNCRYLYIATGSGRQLFQYDMFASDITASQTLVGTTAYCGFGGIAIGPDNKIYCSRFVSSPYLGVINNPDLTGIACNYIDTGLYLGGKFCQGGVPNFPNTMLGGCVDRSLINNEDPDTGSSEITPAVDHLASHHVMLSWEDTKAGKRYMVMYKQENMGWTKIIVNDNQTTLEDLKPNTDYEIRVVAIPNDIPGYEPLTDHFLADDLAAVGNKTNNLSEGSAHFTTGSDIDFELYPNPSREATTTVALNTGDENIDLVIKIIDMQGKVNYEQKMNNITGYYHFELPIAGLDKGIYNVQLETETSNAVKKLVIVR